MGTCTHIHKQVKYPQEHNWFWIFLLPLIGPRWGINNHIWKFLYKWQESQWLGSQIFHAPSLPDTQDKCGLHLPPYKYTHSHLQDSLLWQILVCVKAELVSVLPIPPNVDSVRTDKLDAGWHLRSRSGLSLGRGSRDGKVIPTDCRSKTQNQITRLNTFKSCCSPSLPDADPLWDHRRGSARHTQLLPVTQTQLRFQKLTFQGKKLPVLL